MKRIFVTLFAISISLNGFGQAVWEIDFENWDFNGRERVFIDTVSNENNIWQIGQPSKTIFNEAYSIPNAIVTDTLNDYPPNDTSSFIIKHNRIFGQHGHTIVLAFKYKIDSDTIDDYGKIESSFDEGETWIDLLDDENINNFGLWWSPEKPCLTGRVEEWQDVYVNLQGMDYHFDYNDTILYRFTFVSDEFDNPKEGWLIDNILLEDWYENVEDISNDFNSLVYPNPISDHGVLEFDNNRQAVSIEFYNCFGQLVEIIKTTDNQVDIRKKTFKPGLYLYKIKRNSESSFGKFIVE